MSSPCINESQLWALPVKPCLSSLASWNHIVSSFPWASRWLSWPVKLVMSSACLTCDTTELTAPVLLKGVLKDWPAFVDSWNLKSILPGYSVINSFLNNNSLRFALMKIRIATLLSWKWIEISYFGQNLPHKNRWVLSKNLKWECLQLYIRWYGNNDHSIFKNGHILLSGNKITIKWTGNSPSLHFVVLGFHLSC